MATRFADVEELIRLVRGKGMLNKQLQDLLATAGESKAGVKAAMQDRIIARLRDYAKCRDIAGYENLKAAIQRTSGITANGSSPNHAYPSTNSIFSHGVVHNSGMGGGPTLLRPVGDVGFAFKASPFYTIEGQVGVTRTCEVMSQHRHTLTIPIRASTIPIHASIPASSDLRVMVFCRADGTGPQDIAFPHQSDLKVNAAEVKANLRGLKNKPGSTRPVDITGSLRLSPATYNNQVDFTFALTNKRFFFSIFVVRVFQVEALVAKILAGRKIAKNSVIQEMLSKSRDADIVATSSALSLKCPISTLRMEVPCRSTACQHNQCFDATSYLQLQEQGPTWQCPICNKSAPFDTLVVDEYVQDILAQTPKSADQVVVEPNGEWKLPSVNGNSKARSGPSDGESDDEDIVIVSKVNGVPKADTPASASPSTLNTTSTPKTMSSRGASATASNGATTTMSGKRPITQVIDLTSDDDEISQPAAKRQSYGFPLPSMTLPEMSFRGGSSNSSGNRQFNGTTNSFSAWTPRT